MPNVRVATFDGPGEPPVIREVPKPGCRPRLGSSASQPAGSAAPTSTSSGATGPGPPLAVHPRPRAGGSRGGDRGGADRGLHGPAPRGGIQGHAAAAHAVWELLLLRALPRDGQQVPDSRVLWPLPRLRDAAAPLGRVGGDGLRRSRRAAGDEGLQATRRHADCSGRPLRAIDLVRPRFRPRPARRLLPRGRHRCHPGLGTDRSARRGCRPGDGGGARHRRRGSRGSSARAVQTLRCRGHRLAGGPPNAGGAHRGRASADRTLRGRPRDGLLGHPRLVPRASRCYATAELT